MSSESNSFSLSSIPKHVVYKCVLILGLITLPLLLLAIIILLTNVRAKPSKYKLILFLSVITFFCTLSYIIPWDFNESICKLQGNLMLFFETSQYLTSMLVGYHTKYVIIKQKGSDKGFYKRQLFMYGLISLGIPLILLIIANIKNAIGYCSPWCWIVESGAEAHLNYVYRIIIYAIMIGSQLLNIYFSISIIRNLNKDPSISNEQKRQHKSLIYKMLRYPICLLACIVPGLINRIVIFEEDLPKDENKEETMNLLSSIATIMLSSSGFFILIIYGLTLNTIMLLKESCKKKQVEESDYFIEEANLSKGLSSEITNDS